MVFFLEPQPKVSKSNEYQHAEMDADAEVTTCSLSGAGCQVLAAASRHPIHGESGMLEGGGVSLEAIFKLNFF